VWNKIVEKYKDKPIIFLAVNSGNKTAMVDRYRKSTGLVMPVLVDEDRSTEKRYGFTISLRNIIQWRVIDGEGKIVGYSAQDAVIQQALKNARFELGDRAFSDALKPTAKQVEWGEYEAAVKTLKRYLRTSNKTQKADALYILDFLEKKAQALAEKARAEEQAGRGWAAYLIHQDIVKRFSLCSAAGEAKKATRRLDRLPAIRKEKREWKSYQQALKLLADKSKYRRKQGRTLLQQIKARSADTEAGRRAKEKLAELGPSG